MLEAYESGPNAWLGERIQRVFVAIVPPHADAACGTGASGANVGFAVLDRLRAGMLHRVGRSEWLKPRSD